MTAREHVHDKRQAQRTPRPAHWIAQGSDALAKRTAHPAASPQSVVSDHRVPTAREVTALQRTMGNRNVGHQLAATLGSPAIQPKDGSRGTPPTSGQTSENLTAKVNALQPLVDAGDRLHAAARPATSQQIVVQRWITQETVNTWQLMSRLLAPENQQKPIDFVAIGAAYTAFRADVLRYIAMREALVHTGFAARRIATLLRRLREVSALVARTVAQDYPDLYDSLQIRLSAIYSDLFAEMDRVRGATKLPAAAGAGAPIPGERRTREAEDTPRETFALEQEYKGLTLRDASGRMIAELDGVNLLTGTIYEDKTADPAAVTSAWIDQVGDVITRKMDAIRTRNARVATRDARDRFRTPSITHLRQMKTFVLRLGSQAERYDRRFLYGLRSKLSELGRRYPGMTFVLMTGSNVVDNLASQPPDTAASRRIKSFEAPT